MSETTPMFIGYEVREIRRFIDENIDTIGRDVLRRTIHHMLDRACEAAHNRYFEYQKHLGRQAEIMAETARRNVRLEAALKPVMECDLTDVDASLNCILMSSHNAVREAQRIMKEGDN